jgi:hypothetical protein
LPEERIVVLQPFLSERLCRTLPAVANFHKA